MKTKIFSTAAIYFLSGIILFIINSQLYGKPELHTLKIIVGQTTREYTIYLPSAYDGEKTLPAVLMFHGGGGQSLHAMKETGWNKKAEKEGFIAVFPQAMPPDPARPISFRNNSPIWNDGSGRFHAGKKDIDDIGFINALIDELVTRFHADAKCIFATGFSNGASMTFRAGLELSERIAAIAPVSGALWITNIQPAVCLPLCYIHGGADTMNPVHGGAPKTQGGIIMGEGKSKPPVKNHILRWAEICGIPAEPLTAVLSNGITMKHYAAGRNGSTIMQYTIEKCGHTWPGGISLLPASMVGEVTGEFIAVDVIWEFFKKTRSCQRNTVITE
ncbi:MAG: hypothetical protein A2096_10460 [Spirochaetes bacterium GWF1_41_5]|nr:MAG: hypothetical protein A2096_10460 [Spirochaetes bacterium GWF1_41_5]HBE01027.1 hypothetical protein [Spirochaetia bacterium]